MQVQKLAGSQFSLLHVNITNVANLSLLVIFTQKPRGRMVWYSIVGFNVPIDTL